MLKIVRDKWDREKIKAALGERTDLNRMEYRDLVKLTFDTLLNDDDCNMWDVENLTEINDGDWQGTLLFVIPKDTYQPCQDEYLMTCVGYGSCSACDTLQSIQDFGGNSDEGDISSYADLCQHLFQNTVKPFKTYGCDDDYMEVD